MNNQDKFILQLIEIMPSLSEVYGNILKYWQPNTPPLTMLMADVGRFIAEQELKDNELKQIMAVIENAITSEDSRLGDAVATGLLESLVNSVKKRGDKYALLACHFGIESKKHVEAWTEQKSYYHGEMH